MLPITHKDRCNFGYRLREQFNNWKRLIFSDRNSRNLFLFLLLNLSFAFVELFYGIWTNSLGLISDSFHMFFDCTGLLAGLAASVITKWRANERFSYGFVRAEVLAGFVNSLFLIFVAFFILSEGVERLIEPPEVKHERLFVVSVLGLIVNLVGIYAFNHGGGHHGHSHGGSSHGHSHSHSAHNNVVHVDFNNHHQHQHHYHEQNHHSHNHQTISMDDDHDHHHHHHDSGHSHRHSHGHFQGEDLSAPSNGSQIMRGVFLHILADTLGSVGVIVSAVLMHLFGWMIADPICSIFIAVLIVLSVLSLIKESVFILMQRQPVALDRLLPSCYQKVTGLAGVYAVQEPHFWTLCSEVYVGALKLEVSRNIDAKYVVSHTRMIFEAIGVKQLYVQLDYV